jgi:hypothetical protein
VWVALPGADAAAGGVEEHAIELRLGGQPRAAVPSGGAEVENARAGRAAAEGREPPRIAVRRPEQALVAHQVGKVQELAALPGASVPPSFARLGRAGVADELGGEVLDFKGPAMEGRSEKEVLSAPVAERVRRAVGRAAIAEFAAERHRGARAGAEPEHGLALQLAQEIRG